MPARRTYRSSLREERAVETRLRIVRAAEELFATSGFAATTVAAIADRAGVAAPTVYATWGSKAAIVRALLAQIENDAGQAGWTARIDEEPDPASKLALFARWSRHLFSAGRPVFVAALEAVGDPAVREMLDQGDRTARKFQRAMVAAIADAGALRPGSTQRWAADVVWTLSGPGPYLRLTGDCGWSDGDYERWLAGLLVGQLLDTGLISGPGAGSGC